MCLSIDRAYLCIYVAIGLSLNRRVVSLISSDVIWRIRT